MRAPQPGGNGCSSSALAEREDGLRSRDADLDLRRDCDLGESCGSVRRVLRGGGVAAREPGGVIPKLVAPPVTHGSALPCRPEAGKYMPPTPVAH